jgi:hypothetical protein
MSPRYRIRNLLKCSARLSSAIRAIEPGAMRSLRRWQRLTQRLCHSFPVFERRATPPRYLFIPNWRFAQLSKTRTRSVKSTSIPPGWGVPPCQQDTGRVKAIYRLNSSSIAARNGGKCSRKVSKRGAVSRPRNCAGRNFPPSPYPAMECEDAAPLVHPTAAATLRR